MGRLRGTAGPCVVVALLLPAVAGCGSLPEEPLPERGFGLRYEKPVAADKLNYRFLRDWNLPGLVVADLNAYVDLPHLVTVVARSCHGEGTGYDPDARRIELCYDDLTEQSELVTRGSEGLAEIVRETLYHEAGHALIDALDLPTEEGRAEEDAADRFAQVMLLRDPEGDDTLLVAARAYERAAAAEREPDPSDEHAPDAVRAESHRCAVYGHSPDRHKDLATPARSDCAATWAGTRDTWTRDLAPLLRR
ncbi:hypothetical protein J7F03_00800 [Streptomyces sp. ISL-43]|uniref:DUF4344 domain-containing metallopeptidase n=1 Tax=Streptomyces sp. ISL-43 TaxID=2819183 RepID=UPI001BE8B602|nr:DUF4344 domain-containing metallopeptidase [Streptomyces sp. ISL-43]MBT2445645.1 hypothetical protein [Streptomyces sp. ISL-43]